MDISRKPRKNNLRFIGTMVLIGSFALPLAACSASDPAPTKTPASQQSNDKKPSKTPVADDADASDDDVETDPSGLTAPGYAYGEIPPIPAIVLPSLALLDTAVAGFANKAIAELPKLPGLTVALAACGDVTDRSNATSSTQLSADGTTVNNGDGSGSFTIDGVTVAVDADGSGAYVGPLAQVYVNADGTGSYDTDTVSVSLADSGAWYTDSVTGIDQYNGGDGSARYEDAHVEIWNDGSGAGYFSSGDLMIVNNGDGTGSVNSKPVKVDPLPPVPAVGKFPPMSALAPVQTCGTTITLEDGLLFDFGSSTIRPGAEETLTSLATAMTALNVPAAEVNGFTDSIGDEGENQVLSEERAQAVVDALSAAGVTSNLSPVGYGEAAPIAANEINGADNPAGRELNRRVEIFIPTF